MLADDTPSRRHRVLKLRTPSERFWRRVDKSGGPDSCWNWLGSPRNMPERHGRFQASSQGEPKRVVQAHRFAYEELVGPIPAGCVLRHSCDNPRCVNPAHLRPGSQADNVADMWQRDRGYVPEAVGRPGEAHHNAKMSSERVEDLRRRREAGETVTSLAAEYGLSKAQVSRIVNGKRWRQ